MIVLLVLHALLGLTGLAFGSRLGRRGLLLGILAPIATAVWLIAELPGVLDGHPVTESVEWLPALGVNLDLRLDGFSALMVVLVAGIGVAVYAYALSYFPPQREGLGRLVALLTLFGGSMLGLVLADNLIVLYGFWELTTVTSFLLIGNNHRDGRSRAAALQALLVTSLGALAMLAGFIVIGQSAGTYRLSEILAHPPSGTAVEVALVLVLLGAFTKSAQYPFHGWLPAAMVAPTPVSAYLHSATMVKAGVYLIARLAPAFEEVSFWRFTIVAVGLYTMIAGGLRAMRQTDLKLLLAMGTISQLGFMMAVFGLGTAESSVAGCVALLAHGLYKATAFMVVGILDHQHGTRDTRLIPRMPPGWRLTAAVTIVAATSMAGFPLVLGFVAKEAELQALIDETGNGSALAVAVAVLGSIVTVAYSLRFCAGALGSALRARQRARRRRVVRAADGVVRRARGGVVGRHAGDRAAAGCARQFRRRGGARPRCRRRRGPPRRVARGQPRARAVGRRPRRRVRVVPETRGGRSGAASARGRPRRRRASPTAGRCGGSTRSPTASLVSCNRVRCPCTSV